jgi:hypothetical protein
MPNSGRGSNRGHRRPVTAGGVTHSGSQMQHSSSQPGGSRPKVIDAMAMRPQKSHLSDLRSQLIKGGSQGKRKKISAEKEPFQKVLPIDSTLRADKMLLL